MLYNPIDMMIHIIQNIFQIIIESSSYNSMLEGIEHCSTELTIRYHIISVGLPKERYVMVCHGMSIITSPFKVASL